MNKHGRIKQKETMKTTAINKLIKQVGLALVILSGFASCGEIYDLNGFDWEPDTPASDSVFNRYIYIRDFGKANLQEGHRPADATDPLLFSLEKFTSVHNGYKTSTRWDICFLGVNIESNNGSKAGYGYGSSAIGGLLLLDSAFSAVAAVPEGYPFVIPGNYGLNDFMGSGLGHALYSFLSNPIYPEIIELDGHPDPEKSLMAKQYKHMIYYLSEDLANLFPSDKFPDNDWLRPRTFIVRTANGNYAKLEMQSYYKGTVNPKEMSRKLPQNYHSFRYMVIPASEKRFGFIERRPPLTIDFSKKTSTVGQMAKQ